RLVSNLLLSRKPAPGTLALTARQRDILRCLREGLDNQAIAWRTGLSVKTIENHLTRLYRQINVQSRLEAANYVAQHPEALGPHEPPAAPFMGLPHVPGAARLTILIVDDNMRYRTQMRRMIGKAYPAALRYESDN